MIKGLTIGLLPTIPLWAIIIYGGYYILKAAGYF